MRKQQLIPVYHQGQLTGPGSEPDNFVTRKEMLRGFAADPRVYLSINNRKALMKLSTCMPKYPDHKDSEKGGWQGVALNCHSFEFRRDYGALQRRLGPKVLQLTVAGSTRKHGRTHCPQRVSYSPHQARNVNGPPPAAPVVRTRA
jgi:hypothetical protein